MVDETQPGPAGFYRDGIFLGAPGSVSTRDFAGKEVLLTSEQAPRIPKGSIVKDGLVIIPPGYRQIGDSLKIESIPQAIEIIQKNIIPNSGQIEKISPLLLIGGIIAAVLILK